MSIRSLFTGLRARYHVWNGRRAYRAGRLRVAGRHLELALASGHESFGAYLLQGKVAYRIRDMQRAMDCFRLARRTDPARYAMEGFPSGFIESLADHSAAPAPQRYRIVIEARQTPSRRQPRPDTAMSSSGRRRRPEPGHGEGHGSGSENGGGDSASALGDFSSRAEQENARSRPMFRPGEWADIDWDVEARKLFGD